MNPGELNYVITNTILTYVEMRGKNYETYNAIVGALESAKMELYRRMVVPYEDARCAENGDVY